MVEKDHCFVGLDAYQKVIASDVDLVLLAAPGGFRPLHLKAAIDAGKHVFCEKPMAVDGPGLRKVIEAVALAKKNKLAIRAGLCNRFEPALQEAIQRIHDGAIGDMLAIYATRWAARFRPSSTDSASPAGATSNGKCATGAFPLALGDWMMEVACHEVDKMAWVMHEVRR